MQTTETMTTGELEYLRDGLKRELPHLSCTVEMNDGTLYVTAVKA